ncbi:MAG: fumarylacetoacetate hydrolase family protein [Chloroflexi bacterium]|nr:fumarylacetoacetate hydrolase family protein [Chloroflexota bacterium]MCL5025327.1 fumarylacetoacetate hydrolase family protein [Chloroflexota bacterium]
MVEDGQVVELQGSIFGSYRPAGRPLPLSDVKLLAPCAPSKLLCFGLNYAAHAAEGGSEPPTSPILFLKAPSSVIGPGDSIVLPDHTSRIDHEAELAVVIKDVTKDVSEAEALQHVLGYTCSNDVSHRPLQKSDGQWCRAKSFDTFGPMGPWIVTDIDPGNLSIKCLVNGEVKQSSNTNDLIFSVPYLVSWLSKNMTLMPGDVIMTGTPSGVGPLKAGDVVEIAIEGIGTLSNPVR